jgi:hypothetical protein
MLRLHVVSFRVLHERPSRSGGKPPLAHLLRRVRRRSARGRVLSWLITDYPAPRTMGATMAQFDTNRTNIRNTLKALHRYHGIGYAIAANEIRILPPKRFEEAPEYMLE